MYHLKLIKGLSYRGIVSATKKAPDVYVEDKAAADAAAATGFFKLVGETGGEKQEDSESGSTHLDEAALLTYKLDDLKALAADMGIDTTNLKTKADYAAAIAAVGVTPGAGTDGNGNEADYEEGSPTMADLQEQQ